MELAAEKDPPPLVTLKLTDTPCMAAPFWSLTCTTSDVPRVEPTVPVCVSPSTFTIDAGVGVGGSVLVGSCLDVQAVVPKARALHSNVVR